jgi:hypothetical protein
MFWLMPCCLVGQRYSGRPLRLLAAAQDLYIIVLVPLFKMHGGLCVSFELMFVAMIYAWF